MDKHLDHSCGTAPYELDFHDQIHVLSVKVMNDTFIILFKFRNVFLEVSREKQIHLCSTLQKDTSSFMSIASLHAKWLV